ncbi:MAG: tetratricopeptide repeat protein [Deltaproteobacteria bacterium]|nr:tetratricopeptide repeat protein [Deltaproteobacteria bacterium]
MKRCWATILYIILGLQALNANADDTVTDDKKETMKKLYYDGIDLYEKQQYVAAAQAFRELIELSNRDAYYFNLAECEYARKRFDLALEAFNIYLTNVGEKVAHQRRARAEEIMKEARTAVGYVNLEETDSVALWIDDEYRGDTPLRRPVALLPGEHTVILRQNANELFKTHITVEPGKIVQVKRPARPLSEETIQPKPQLKAPVSKTNTNTDAMHAERETRKTSPLKNVGIVTASIGGAVLISALVTGKLALSKSSQLEDNCDGKKGCAQSNKDLYETADNLTSATNVLLITGGVLAITGVILAVAGHKRTKSGEKISVGTTPIFGTATMGVAFHGSF